LNNSRTRVPSLGDGPGNWVQFRNGKGKETSAVPFAEIKRVAVGTASNKPSGVAHITWNTGGSGYWNTIILYRESKGKITQVGNFSDCIGSTDKLEIKNNKVFVHLTDKESVDSLARQNGVRKEGKGWISLAPSAFSR